jgi:hypothetical protein
MSTRRIGAATRSSRAGDAGVAAAGDAASGRSIPQESPAHAAAAQIDGFERRVEETELLADVVKLAAEVAHDLLLS